MVELASSPLRAIADEPDASPVEIPLTGAATLTVTVTEFVYFLAEGATGDFFDLDLALANPTATDAPVTIDYLKDDATTVAQTLTVPAQRRVTVPVESTGGPGQHGRVGGGALDGGGAAHGRALDVLGHTVLRGPYRLGGRRRQAPLAIRRRVAGLFRYLRAAR